MGIDFHALNLLLRAKAMGVDFSRTCMIGRQGVHMAPGVFDLALENAGLSVSAVQREDILGSAFAEPLFQHVLGAEEVASLDASAYEGATYVQDMNRPFDLGRRFTTVVDFGTTEHVFNISAAISNIIRMTEEGGHIIQGLPANSLCGHGFYQFSPEFFFSTYSQGRGFSTPRVFLTRDSNTKTWWRVAPNFGRGKRVLLHGAEPVSVVTIVQRLPGAILPEDAAPHQSDYVAEWTLDGAEDRHAGGRSALKNRVDELLTRHGLRFLVKTLLRKPLRAPRRPDPSSDYEAISIWDYAQR